MADVHIIYCQDGVEWVRFLCEACSHDPAKSVVTTELQDIYPLISGEAQNNFETCKIYTIVMTPDFENFMLENPRFEFQPLIKDPQNAVLFSCGVETTDRDFLNIKDKFPNFDEQWTKTSTENYQEWNTDISVLLENYVPPPPAPPVKQKTEKLPPPENPDFRMVPPQVNCMEETEVIVILNEPILKDGIVTIHLRDANDDADLNVKEATRIAPNCYSFVTSKSSISQKIVTVFLDNSDVTPNPAILEYFSPLEVVDDYAQFYLTLLDCICQTVREEKLVTPKQLSEISLDYLLQSANISIHVLEEVFRIHDLRTGETSTKDLPSVLHWAAKNGMTKLTCELMDLPFGHIAISVVNKNDRYPSDLAFDNGNQEVGDYLKEFMELVEAEEDMYTVMRAYVRLNAGEDSEEICPYDYTRKEELPGYLKMYKDVVIDDEDADEYVDVPNVPPPARLMPAPVVPPRDIETGKPLVVTKKKTKKRKSRKKHEEKPIPPDPMKDIPQDEDLSHMPQGHKEIIEIMNMVKRKEINIMEAELLMENWKKQHTSSNASFKDRQENLKKQREQLKEARKFIDIEEPKTKKKSRFTKLFSKKTTEKKPVTNVYSEQKPYDGAIKSVQSRPAAPPPIMEEPTGSEQEQEAYMDMTFSSSTQLSPSARSSVSSRVSAASIGSSERDSGINLAKELENEHIPGDDPEPPPVAPRDRNAAPPPIPSRGVKVQSLNPKPSPVIRKKPQPPTKTAPVARPTPKKPEPDVSPKKTQFDNELMQRLQKRKEKSES